MKKHIRIVCAILAVVFYSEAIELMDELVVQSTRIETPLDLMSSSVDVITAEELQASGVSYVSDALLLQPGISGSRNGGPGGATSIYLRGAKPQHTLILVDGVRMNGQLDLTGYDLANLDLNSVERIEILKGPQSTLYGSDAMAGVINIITTKSKTPHRYIQREKGRYGSEYTTAGISGGREKLAYTLSYSDYSNEGFSAQKNDTEDDGLKNNTAAFQIGGRANEKTEWHATIRFIDSIGEYDSGSSYYDKEQLITRLAFEHTISETLRTQAGVSYFDLKRTEHTSETSDFFNETRSYDWSLTAQPSAKSTLLLSVEGHEDDYDYDEYWGNSGKGELESHAYLGLWQYQPIAGTALSLSAREDHHSQFGNAFTYQGGLSHTLAKTDTRIYTSYGTGFKAPIPYQSHKNPTLKAEESEGWEIGFEQSFLNNQVEINLAVFQKEYSQFIDYDQGVYFNSPVALSDGFEVGLTLYPRDTLTLQVGYSYLDNDSLDSGFTIRRPTHKLDSTLSWLATDKLQLTALIGYVGSREGFIYEGWNRIPTAMASYVPVQVAARYQADETLTLFARIENLLDEEYELADGYNTPRRGLYGGARIDF